MTDFEYYDSPMDLSSAAVSECIGSPGSPYSALTHYRIRDCEYVIFIHLTNASFSFSPRKVRVKNFGAKDFFPSRKSFALKTIRQGRGGDNICLE